MTIPVTAPSPNAFVELVERVRPEVNRRLDERLEALSRAVRPEGVAVTVDAFWDLVRRGGKRFRAGMVVAAYVGVKPRARRDPAIDAGVALELLHGYLLVQDDWMDGDRTRRGGPSVHAALGQQLGSRALGECSAILSSDFGWGLAIQALAEVRAPSRNVLRALGLWWEAHRDVLMGQQLDMLGHVSPDGRTVEIERVHELKTASYTVRAPLLIGASLAGAPEPTLRALRRFAQPLGVAYQLRDDLLGVFAGPRFSGKPLGADLRAAKRTAVTVAAESHLDRRGREAYRQVYGKRRVSQAQLVRAAEQLERCGARRSVELRLAELCSRARGRAQRLALHPRARAWLGDAVRLVEQPLPPLRTTLGRARSR